MMFKYVYAVLFIIIALVTNSHGQALDRAHLSMVNPLEYGANCTDETLNSAVTAIGSDEATLFLTKTDRDKSDCIWDIAADVTIPGNVTLYIPYGAMLQIGNGVTVYVHGGFHCGMYQCISGAGRVQFAQPTWAGEGGVADLFPYGAAIPDWWGAEGDGLTDDSTAFNAADDSFRTDFFVDGSHGVGLILVPPSPKRYRVDQNVTLERSHLVGMAPLRSSITMGGTSNSIIVRPPPGVGFEMAMGNIIFGTTGSRTANTPLVIIDNGQGPMSIDSCRFVVVGTGIGLQLQTTANSRVFNNTFFVRDTAIGIDITSEAARVALNLNEFSGSPTGQTGIRNEGLQTHVGSENLYVGMSTNIENLATGFFYNARKMLRYDDFDFDFGPIADGSFAIRNFIVGPLGFGNTVLVGMTPELPDGLFAHVKVDEDVTNALTLQIFNLSGASYDPPSMTFDFTVFREQ